MKANQHFLVLSLPVQSHIHPTLQFAKVLARAGAKVTYATTQAGMSRLGALPNIDGLSYTTFHNGAYDETAPAANNFVLTLSREGPTSLAELINDLSNKGTPVDMVIYTVLLPWVADIARELHVPSAFLFIQCATAFAVFHRFFKNGYHNIIHETNPDISIELPGMPLFTYEDMPQFLLPSDPYYPMGITLFREHMETLTKEANPCVLLNTFNKLEDNIVELFSDDMKFMPIGPLIPSAYTDGSDVHDKSFGGTLFQNPNNYMTWLDSKPEGSVVYVSFGSIGQLKEDQKQEILHGLMASDRPFLWVIRDIKEEDVKSMIMDHKIDEELGFIVPWCSQVEVLSHRAIGCFVSHCGWNSTSESIANGVPIVGCPQFAEQRLNIKVVEEVWGNGIRVKEDDGVYGREEIQRCLDVVMGEGEKGEEIRKNAKKWKGLALEAVKEGGSSYNNVKKFLEM